MTESIVLDGKVCPVVNGAVINLTINGRRTSRGRRREGNTWTETLDEFRARVQAELDADRVRLAPCPCTNTE